MKIATSAADRRWSRPARGNASRGGPKMRPPQASRCLGRNFYAELQNSGEVYHSGFGVARQCFLMCT